MPELSAKAYNMVQHYVMEHSRFGIPMMMSSECPHGHQALGGGLLPVNLSAGATFDPALLSVIRDGEEVKSATLRTHALQPRWQKQP